MQSLPRHSYGARSFSQSCRNGKETRGAAVQKHGSTGTGRLSEVVSFFLVWLLEAGNDTVLGVDLQRLPVSQITQSDKRSAAVQLKSSNILVWDSSG